ncbi:MAG: hypothetical protein ACJ8LD_17285 [Pantoea agglomerans]
MENQFIPIITSRITHRTTHSNRRRKSMRIRDYIRDDPRMGQKRDNKSGLQDAVLVGRRDYGFREPKTAAKSARHTSRISGIRQKQASSVR